MIGRYRLLDTYEPLGRYMAAGDVLQRIRRRNLPNRDAVKLPTNNNWNIVYTNIDGLSLPVWGRGTDWCGLGVVQAAVVQLRTAGREIYIENEQSRLGAVVLTSR